MSEKIKYTKYAKTHVVVTIYRTKVNTTLVHTYGPKTRTEATKMRTDLINAHGAEIASGTLAVHVCKMLDFSAEIEAKL